MIALFLTPMIGAKKCNLNVEFYNHCLLPTQMLCKSSRAIPKACSHSAT